jgi:hypothetical protein
MLTSVVHEDNPAWRNFVMVETRSVRGRGSCKMVSVPRPFHKLRSDGVDA